MKIFSPTLDSLVAQLAQFTVGGGGGRDPPTTVAVESRVDKKSLKKRSSTSSSPFKKIRTNSGNWSKETTTSGAATAAVQKNLQISAKSSQPMEMMERRRVSNCDPETEEIEEIKNGHGNGEVSDLTPHDLTYKEAMALERRLWKQQKAELKRRSRSAKKFADLQASKVTKALTEAGEQLAAAWEYEDMRREAEKRQMLAEVSRKKAELKAQAVERQRRLKQEFENAESQSKTKTDDISSMDGSKVNLFESPETTRRRMGVPNFVSTALAIIRP